MAFEQVAAESDFGRQRRRQALTRIAARLRLENDDVVDMLAFEDVVAALGRRSQVDLGLQTVALDSIVGTAGRRPRDFDRSFRPVTRRLRDRWLRVAAARRRGVDLAPIDVFRIGPLHFVEDGHHRVSVARAMGDETICAHVREVLTALPATPDLFTHELALRHHERLFHERVPLPPAARARIKLSDEWRYAQLASLIEAMGYRETQASQRVVSREELARRWYREHYEPIVAIARENDLGGPGTDTDRYLRLVMLRYLLLHTHDWSDEVMQRLRAELRAPKRGDDTLVHQILGELDAPEAPAT
jgi:hypothetical protein